MVKHADQQLVFDNKAGSRRLKMYILFNDILRNIHKVLCRWLFSATIHLIQITSNNSGTDSMYLPSLVRRPMSLYEVQTHSVRFETDKLCLDALS